MYAKDTSATNPTTNRWYRPLRNAARSCVQPCALQNAAANVDSCKGEIFDQGKVGLHLVGVCDALTSERRTLSI